MCQFVATFWAQISYGVSFSLGRIVPFISATSLKGPRVAGLNSFIPFVVFSIGGTIILSFFWEVPQGVQKFYGELRSSIQIVVFVSLVLNSIGLSRALLHKRASLYFREGLTICALIHGVASLYQLAASELGLPLIGISRAHLQEVDVGVFDGGESSLVYRVGGLAGEPKTVAVIFGIHILTMFFVPLHSSWSKNRRLLEFGVGGLSFVCFVMTYSTSVYIGIAIAFCVLAWRFWRESGVRFIRIVVFGIVCALVLYLAATTIAGDSDVITSVRVRTIDRYYAGELDPVIGASLDILENNVHILLFGTGMGGSSFAIMRSLGAAWNLSYAPNIGIVFFLIEWGILGTGLFLFPCWLLYRRKMPVPGDPNYWECRFFLCVGVSTLIIHLLSSGIYLGYPLAVSCLAAAYNLGLSSELAPAIADGHPVGNVVPKGSIVTQPPQGP
jgi:hypothetical protein